MTNRILFLATFIFFLSSVDGKALTLENFYFNAKLNQPVQINQIYQINLPYEILSQCNFDYRDIRVFAPDNTEIPYVILDHVSPEKYNQRYNLKTINYTETEKSVIVTVELAQKLVHLNRLDLDIGDKDFKRNVDLYGSQNQTEWRLLSQDTIYDFSSQIDLRKTAITFPLSEFRYYRLDIFSDVQQERQNAEITLNYNGLDFKFNEKTNQKLRINLIQGSEIIDETNVKTVYDSYALTQFDAKIDEQGDTTIDSDCGAPFDYISFSINNPYFYRKVYIYGSQTREHGSNSLLVSGYVYSFPLNKGVEKVTRLVNYGHKRQYYNIKIDNQDNPPLTVNKIAFQWKRKNLFFIALHQDAIYSLAFSNHKVAYPDYDLKNFITQQNWENQPHTPIGIEKIHKSAQVKPVPSEMMSKQAKIENIILITIVIALVIGLSFWLFKLIRAIPNNKA
jgi:hypothetical protein